MLGSVKATSYMLRRCAVRGRAHLQKKPAAEIPPLVAAFVAQLQRPLTDREDCQKKSATVFKNDPESGFAPTASDQVRGASDCLATRQAGSAGG
jgi:hypothetical protein